MNIGKYGTNFGFKIFYNKMIIKTLLPNIIVKNNLKNITYLRFTYLYYY